MLNSFKTYFDGKGSIEEREKQMTSVTEQLPKNQTNMMQDMIDIVHNYDLDNASIGMLASHSALDLADGAKEEGFPTVAVCESGREMTYRKYYKRIIDKTIVLDNFKEMLNEDTQKKLKEHNVIFVPNRSFTTYIPIQKIIDDFHVPMFGNRSILIADEREEQYTIFKDARIECPEKLKSYEEINTLCMVKAKEPIKKIERAFFTAASPAEFLSKLKTRFGEMSEEMIHEQIDKKEIWIEKFVDGAQFNFNYFYSPIKKRIEFLGIDRRIQTNLDGILRLPADEQVNRHLNTQYVEIGHESATIRESKLEEVFAIGERFVETSKILYPPHGIIGPFSLQGAVTTELNIVIYDLSPRMPGSPVLYNSPYSKYYFGETVTSGRRVAMEIKDARDTDQMNKIIT